MNTSVSQPTELASLPVAARECSAPLTSAGAPREGAFAALLNSASEAADLQNLVPNDGSTGDPVEPSDARDRPADDLRWRAVKKPKEATVLEIMLISLGVLQPVPPVRFDEGAAPGSSDSPGDAPAAITNPLTDSPKSASVCVTGLELEPGPPPDSIRAQPEARTARSLVAMVPMPAERVGASLVDASQVRSLTSSPLVPFQKIQPSDPESTKSASGEVLPPVSDFLSGAEESRPTQPDIPMNPLGAPRMNAAAPREWRPVDLTTAPQRGTYLGMIGAVQDVQMKTNQNRNELPPSERQNVPILAVDEAHDISSHQSLTAAFAAAEIARFDAASMFPPKPWAGEMSADAVPVPSLPTTAADRFLHSVCHEVQLMREVQSTALTVVLNPDSNTEIFLRLSLREGRIEAQARCERGDFVSLNSQWGELQRSLSGQGVLLAPLEARPLDLIPGKSATDSGRSPGEPHSGQHSPPEPKSNGELSFVGSVTEPLKRRSQKNPILAARILESWA